MAGLPPQLPRTTQVLTPSGAAPARTFPTQTQHRDHWCWAAVTAAIAKYSRNVDITQEEIVQRVCHTAEDASGAIDQALKEILNIDTDFKSHRFFDDGEAAFQAIAASLAAGKPVPMSIRWEKDGTRHSVCAFDVVKIGGLNALWIFDPAEAWKDNGNQVQRTIADLQRYPSEPGRAAVTGRWDEAFFLRS